MDVRQARTRSKLRNAIYAIAAEKHVNKISVAEVARAAEITRDTFYRHGTSPVELLASFLREDLDDLGRSIGELPATSGTKLSVFDEPERRLLSHIAERSEIYSNALSPRPARGTAEDARGLCGSRHGGRHRGLAPRREPRLRRRSCPHRDRRLARMVVGPHRSSSQMTSAPNPDDQTRGGCCPTLSTRFPLYENRDSPRSRIRRPPTAVELALRMPRSIPRSSARTGP